MHRYQSNHSHDYVVGDIVGDKGMSCETKMEKWHWHHVFSPCRKASRLHSLIRVSELMAGIHSIKEAIGEYLYFWSTTLGSRLAEPPTSLFRKSGHCASKFYGFIGTSAGSTELPKGFVISGSPRSQTAYLERLDRTKSVAKYIQSASGNAASL
jgi:hypothetical protein